MQGVGENETDASMNMFNKNTTSGRIIQQQDRRILNEPNTYDWSLNTDPWLTEKKQSYMLPPKSKAMT